MGMAIRPHELEAAINCCLGQKDIALLKIMYFLTGNASGFRVAEKTILKRCNISESGYKKGRKKLVEMGWIAHKPGEYIQVDYNKIYSDYKKYLAGCPDDTSIKSTCESPQTLRNPPEGSPVISEKVPQDSIGGISEDIYNNINKENNNILKNKINTKENKDSRCQDTCSAAASAAASQVSWQPLREKYYSKEEKKKVKQEYEAWFSKLEREIEERFDLDNGVGYENWYKMNDSDEYKAFKKEAKERREALEQKYGKLWKG